MRTKAPPAWAMHPFLRIAPPFITGITAGEMGWAGYRSAWFCATCSLLVLLGWSLAEPALRWRWKPLTGIAFFPLLAVTGLCCSLIHQARRPVKGAEPPGQRTGLLLQLSDVIMVGPGRHRIRASILETTHDLRPCFRGDIQLFLDDPDAQTPPLPGDVLAVCTIPKPIRNKGNPGEPDFASLQAARDIHVQASAAGKDVLLLGHRDQGTWDVMFSRSRCWVERSMHRYLHDSAAADLASTLLTGHRVSMDPDLLKAYADTGVVHVIAISGLHLGMIYGLILWLVRPLLSRWGRSRAAGMIILPVLWIYACFTGASASVIRSASMFTGNGLAMAMGRKQSFLNGLGSSAMVLLAWRPDWIFDIGFQLSYAALLSIAMFQPRLRAFIRTTHPIARMIWDLVMVTIAAQVLTAPLVAWHFHRLPLLFLFANLPVVPLSSLTLLLGILICLLCWSPILAEPLGRSTTFLIHVMNGQVMGMDAVPHASLTELHPGRIQILIIYVMILLLRSSCQNTCLLTISLCWMGMVACLMLGSQEASRHERQRVLVIFQTRRQSLCALVEGTDMLVLADPAENRDSMSRVRCIDQAVAFYRCRPPTLVRLVPGTTFDWMPAREDWRIVCGQGGYHLLDRSSGVMVSVRNGAYREGDDRTADRNATVWSVADASCALWKIHRWESSAEGVPSRFHSVPEQGAFVLNMDQPSRSAPR